MHGIAFYTSELIVAALILVAALAIDHWHESKRRERWKKSITRNDKDRQ